MVIKMNTTYHMTFHPVLEFMYALILLSEGGLEEYKENTPQIRDWTILDMYNKIESRISTHTKNEIKCLVGGGENICDGIAQAVMMRFIQENPQIKQVEEFIESIRESSIEELMIVLTSTIYHKVTNKSLIGDIRRDEISSDVSKMLELVQSLTIKDDNLRNFYVEFLKHPNEFKVRLLMLFTNFYEVYKEVFDKIEERMQPHIVAYQKELDQDPKAFFRKYLVCDSDAFGADLYIHVSLARLAGADFWTSYSEDSSEWVVLGCHSKDYMEKSDDSEQMLGFLKAISDKKRLQIIELLKKEPSYVNEIAEKMEMTAPTASYHLTQLQTYDIVDYERFEHRFYYKLNKDKLSQWFKRAAAYYTE